MLHPAYVHPKCPPRQQSNHIIDLARKVSRKNPRAIPVAFSPKNVGFTREMPRIPICFERNCFWLRGQL